MTYSDDDLLDALREFAADRDHATDHDHGHEQEQERDGQSGSPPTSPGL